MSCTSGCPDPGVHASWGECLRDKSLRVGWANEANGIDLTRQKAWDKRCADYRAARRQGIQPDSTKVADVRRAVALSNATGRAYGADVSSV